MPWSRVIGQHRVKELLIGALRSQRVPHSYLFYGNEGVGKDALAIELARILVCELQGDEACGICSSCVKMDTLQHPDVKFITPLPVGKGETKTDTSLARLPEDDVKAIQEQYRKKAADPYHQISIPKANIIKINSIRELRRESSMSAFETGKRVFILSDADKMGDEAANTILKTLEEPSPHAMLILTTSRRDLLLPTIISRCQEVRFDPLTSTEIQDALVQREHIDAQKASLLSRLAMGSYRRAVELIQDELGDDRELALAFIRTLLGNNILKLTKDIEDSSKWGKEKVLRFLNLMLIWFRDAFVLNQGGEIINVDQEESLKRFVARFGSADLSKVLTAIENSISHVNRNGYIMLVLLRLATDLRKEILPAPEIHQKYH